MLPFYCTDHLHACNCCQCDLSFSVMLVDRYVVASLQSVSVAFFIFSFLFCCFMITFNDTHVVIIFTLILCRRESPSDIRRPTARKLLFLIAKRNRILATLKISITNGKLFSEC